MPREVVRGFRDGLFALPDPAAPALLSTSTVQAIWRLPIVLASFPDQPLTHSAAELEFALFDTTGSTPFGSMTDYYSWVSHGRLKVTGKVVAIVELPHERAYYGQNSSGLSPNQTPFNAYGAVVDALRECAADIDWTRFDFDGDALVDMLWFVHSGIGGEASPDRNDLWSITSRMSTNWRSGDQYVTETLVPGSEDQYIRIDRFTVLPELSAIVAGGLSEIGVYCHEFGHALGLPDLYDTSNLGATGTVGPGNWSLMSSGAYGADGISPQTPTHVGAWPSLFMGWSQTIHPAHDTTIVLAPLAEGGPIVQWTYQGESDPDHFLIENRQRMGFDRDLPSEGLLIYHVNETVMGLRLHNNSINAGSPPGLMLLEADGDGDLLVGRNRGDRNDPFPGFLGRTMIDDHTIPNTRNFNNQVNNLAMLDVAPEGDQMRFDLRVRARGWQPNRSHSGANFRPAQSNASARIADIAPDGRAAIVTSELVGGVPQIMLRENRTRWSLPMQVSSTTAAALDPTMAMHPNGDLAVVWADSRGGRSCLYARGRVAGNWTEERLLVSLEGDCRSPALAIAADHGYALAFVHWSAAGSSVQFMRFTPGSHFEVPRAVTGDDGHPEFPAVVHDPLGGAYIAWVDHKVGPRRVWFSHFHPDSGVGPANTLTPNSRNDQPSFSLLADDQGTLYTVWLVSGPGVSELRYQRRPRTGWPNPYDDVLESAGEPIQNPVLAWDQDGSMHLVFESVRTGILRASYLRNDAQDGWDAHSTEITMPEDGNARRPVPLPTRGGDLTVAYLGYRGSTASFRTRQRVFSDMPIVVRKDLVPVRLNLSPNPLRAGEPLVFEIRLSSASAPSWLDLYDVAGRRMTSVALARQGEAWRARLSPDQTLGWPSGVYFVRPRGSASAARRLVVIH